MYGWRRLRYVTERSFRRQGRPGAGSVVHKGVMGRLEKATDPAPSPGAAARTPGGRSPAPARTRTGPGRDAAALSPRRRLLMTSP